MAQNNDDVDFSVFERVVNEDAALQGQEIVLPDG
jgi:hypothetical protein